MLIPNATAGMIIGKGGEHIRAIKENTGAFVQLSRKNELPERCIIISGMRDVDKTSRNFRRLVFHFFFFFFVRRNEERDRESS